jgi:hypothetical protein
MFLRKTFFIESIFFLQKVEGKKEESFSSIGESAVVIYTSHLTHE